MHNSCNVRIQMAYDVGDGPELFLDDYQVIAINIYILVCPKNANWHGA